MSRLKSLLFAAAVVLLGAANPACGETTWSQMTLTYSSSAGSCGSNEDASKLFDNNAGTKWCCTSFSSGSHYVEFTASAGVPARLDLVAANDTTAYGGRNWKSWTLYGWENSSWTQIHAWSNETPATKAGETTTYEFANAKEYSKYKVVVNANDSGNIAQMADLKLYVCSDVEVATWATLKENLEAGKNVKLKQDVSQGGAASVLLTGGVNVTLDLNGHKIMSDAASNDRTFTFDASSTGSLTIDDTSSGKTGVIDGLGIGRNVSGGCVYVSPNGKFVLNGGTITNFATASSSDYCGGAICNQGTATLYGGMIADCSATANEGGAIYNGSTGTATVYGGVFVGCSAATAATALFGGSGTTTVYGGVSDSVLIGDKMASGKSCEKVGSKYVVGQSIACDSDDKLTAGTFTFNPTNVEYAAAGVALPGDAVVAEISTTPKTWRVLNSVETVSTLDELKAVLSCKVVNVINLAADIDVPCQESAASMTTTAALMVDRNLTLQGKNGIAYRLRRTGDSSNSNRSLLEVYGNGTYDGITVTLKDVTFDGGAEWAADSTPKTRWENKGSSHYGRSSQNSGVAGRGIIDVANKATVNVESGVTIQNGDCSCNAHTRDKLNADAGSNCYGAGVRVECHYTNGGGTLNLKMGAILKDCSSSGYGGGLGAYNMARLNVYGGTLLRCSSSCGGGIGVTWANYAYGKDDTAVNAGVIALSNATFVDCWANDYGAAVHIDGKATSATTDAYYQYSRITGATVTNCIAPKGVAISLREGEGTEIYLAKKPALVVVDSTGDGNYTSLGYAAADGIYRAGNEVVNEIKAEVETVSFMNAGVEYGKVSVEKGRSCGAMFPEDPQSAGAIFMGWFDGDVQYTADTIINADVVLTAKWGGVTVAIPNVEHATYTNVTVDGESVQVKNGVVLVKEDVTITVHYTADDNYVLTGATSVSLANVAENNKTIDASKVTTKWKHLHCFCGVEGCAVTSHAAHAEVRWQVWTDTTTLPTEAGNYYLANDVTLAETCQPASGVNLCLNGHVVTGVQGQRIVSVAAGRTFTLVDCVGSGALTGGAGVEVAGAFNHLGGIITGNALDSGHGAGVNVTGVYEVGLKAQVTGNTVGDKVENVYLPNDVLVSVDGDFAFGGTATIGVTTETKPTKTTTVAVTTAGKVNSSAYFASDDEVYVAQNAAGNQVVLMIGVAVAIPSVSHATASCILVNGKKVAIASVVKVPLNGTIVVRYAADEGYVLSETTEISLSKVTADNCTLDASAVTSTWHHVHEGVEWQTWTATNALPDKAGNWYLAGDVKLAATYQPMTGVNLCLNGHVVTGVQGERVVSVETGKTFMLADCGSAGMLTGGAGVAVAGTFRHLGGAIAGNALATGHGAGVNVAGSYVVGTKARVKDNVVGDVTENVYLPDGVLVTFDDDFELVGMAKVGVTTETKPTKPTVVPVTGTQVADRHAFFFSDDVSYYAKNGDENAVQLGFVTNPTVKDKSGTEHVIEIPMAWREQNKPLGEEVMEPERPMGNGIPAWQNYVLGIDATNELSGVYADSSQNKSTDKVTLVTKNVVKVVDGYAIKYRLDTKLRGEDDYTNGPNMDSDDFDVSLDGEDPTGVYRLNVVIMKESNELDQTAEAVNLVGIIRATNTNKFCIVAVPWGKLAPGEIQDIAVSNVLKTANLEAGDKLHVYRHDKQVYDTWTLNADKVWDSVVTYKIDKNGRVTTEISDEAAAATIERGSGVWLERLNPTSKPYFLYGQYNEEASSVAIVKGHNLLGAPGEFPYALSNFTGAASSDQVIVPDAVPKVYTFKDGQWGYYKQIPTTRTIGGKTYTGVKSVWTTDESEIPAGMGFWLVNKSGKVKVQ